jgi:hypothetical protein
MRGKLLIVIKVCRIQKVTVLKNSLVEYTVRLLKLFRNVSLARNVYSIITWNVPHIFVPEAITTAADEVPRADKT